jgi:hypothetical protein
MATQSDDLQGNLTNVVQFLWWTVESFTQEIRLRTRQPATQASRLITLLTFLRS